MSKSFLDLATPGVQKLKPYLPGKPVEELERELGISNSIKLASNENPLGPSPLAIEAINNHSAGINYYPDGGGFKLSQRIANIHGVDPDCITLGNGSNDILELVTRAFLTPDHSAVYSEYSFAVYPIVVQAVGAQAIVAKSFPEIHEDQPLGHDLDAFLSSITETTRVVFIANPNNPTGTWLKPDAVEAFLDKVSESIIVILDLAYIEYMDDALKPDIKHILEKYKNVVVTRTFSKVYALAGLRIGYSLSNPEVADIINRVRQPFNTNLLAQAAALASLDDDEHVTKSVNMNSEGKEYLLTELGKRGLSCLPSMGNFLSIHFKQDAQALYEALLHKGVIVRPVGNYDMPEYLRVTIGTQKQNRRFIQALTEVLS
jgi:histidinol-phosphate aminotransferase